MSRSRRTRPGRRTAATTDGNLHRMDLGGGRPTAGTDAVLRGPSIAGNDWRTRALFLLGR